MPRLIKIFEVRIRDGTPEPGQKPFRKIKETFSTEEAFVDCYAEEFPTCAHGHLIHKPEELVGQCVCGRYICKQCEIRRCFLDGNLVCERDAAVNGDKVLCSRHGFLRQLVFSLTGS